MTSTRAEFLCSTPFSFRRRVAFSVTGGTSRSGRMRFARGTRVPDKPRGRLRNTTRNHFYPFSSDRVKQWRNFTALCIARGTRRGRWRFIPAALAAGSNGSGRRCGDVRLPDPFFFRASTPIFGVERVLEFGNLHVSATPPFRSQPRSK